MSEENTITFNDVEYNVDDLGERAQRLVALVIGIRDEAATIQKRLNILQAAEIKLTEELNGELESPQEDDQD